MDDQTRASKPDRRSVLVALMTSPLAALAQSSSRPEAVTISLDKDFSLTIRYGTATLSLNADQIWEALHPRSQSNYLNSAEG